MEKTAPVYFTYLPNGNLRHSQSGLEYRYLKVGDLEKAKETRVMPQPPDVGAIAIYEPETMELRWVVPV